MHDIASLYEQRLSPAMADAYLRRIGYDGQRDGSAATLAQIQQRHLLSVPFENLDILRGTALSLAVPDLFAKIVTRRRGGFCFELNGLFGYLLRALGYEVVDYTARFMLGAAAALGR